MVKLLHREYNGQIHNYTTLHELGRRCCNVMLALAGFTMRRRPTVRFAVAFPLHGHDPFLWIYDAFVPRLRPCPRPLQRVESMMLGLSGIVEEDDQDHESRNKCQRWPHDAMDHSR